MLKSQSVYLQSSKGAWDSARDAGSLDLSAGFRLLELSKRPNPVKLRRLPEDGAGRDCDPLLHLHQCPAVHALPRLVHHKLAGRLVGAGQDHQNGDLRLARQLGLLLEPGLPLTHASHEYSHGSRIPGLSQSKLEESISSDWHSKGLPEGL